MRAVSLILPLLRAGAALRAVFLILLLLRAGAALRAQSPTFQCEGGPRLPRHAYCDGYPDCPREEDVLTVSHFYHVLH